MHLLLQLSIGIGGTPLNTRLVPEGIGSGFRLRHGGGEGGEGSGEGGGGRRRRKGQVAHKLMIRTARVNKPGVRGGEGGGVGGRRLPQFRDPRCIETCSTSTPVGKGCNSALSVQTEILK